MGPALGEAPASGPWGFRHHGTSRRQTPTSAQARRRAGNGEERGRTPAPATPPRSRSRAPTSRTASPPPQPGARGLVAPQRIPQRKLCGPSPRRGARQRPVGVPSSRNLEAPDAHQRASTPQGRERGRAGANPSARNPRHAPALEPPRAARLPPPPQPGARGLVAPPEHPTAKALRAQPSARRPPAARGGSVITEPQGARRPPARKHAAGPGTGKSGGEPQRPQPRHAPALEPPQAARLPPPASARGPRSRRPPEHPTAKALRAQPSARRPASGPWGFRHHGTSRRQTPTSAQARRRAGNGEERGANPSAPQPRHAPALEPPSKPRGVRPPQSGAHGLL